MKRPHALQNISWVSPKLRSGRTRGRGVGVFTRSNIKSGERVIVFGGFAVDIAKLRKLKDDHDPAYDLAITVGYQVADDIVYTPIHRDQLSIAEYLNHSCDPNCGFRGQLDLVAIRNIERGDEISIDYAMAVTTDLFLFKTRCMCNAVACRKRLTSNDWKIPALQKRYRGYFQPYIQEKIKRLNSAH
jgi:SET domain-containing protein